MAEHLTAANFFYALSGGFLPSFLWLWFWLKEDKKNPEPKRAILAAFLGGMIAVPVAMGLEYFTLFYIGLAGAGGLFVWAFIEETLKYFAAKKTAFSKPYFDEPIDALIYMITAALGFASLENALFIFKSLLDSNIIAGINTGSMRFVGATLLHTATSAIVGAVIAFSFFPARLVTRSVAGRHKKSGKHNVIGGIFLAVFLHFAFNYFIMEGEGGNILKILLPLWLVIIIIIFMFEKIKRISA